MEVIELIKTIILGIIQGITEWLPISSTGHMLLFNEFFALNVSDQFLKVFLVVIQLGSILAVIILYFYRLNPFATTKTISERKETWSLWFKIVVASIPVAIVGLLFEDKIDALFYNNIMVIAIALIVYGNLFIWMENSRKRNRVTSLKNLMIVDALIIGLFQTLALIPGTSRSGSTILGATLIRTERKTAAEFSFFLAIPAMFGASVLKLVKYGLRFSQAEAVILATGFLVAFFVSILVIRLLLAYIRNHDFKIFGYYRIILGIIILIYYYIIN